MAGDPKIAAPAPSNATEEAAAPSEIAVLDAETLEGLRMLEAATETTLLAELTRTFREDTPRRIARLREALRTSDADAMRKVAHSLRGSAGALGAIQLLAAATELERAVGETTPGGWEHLVDALEEHAERAFDALENELRKRPPRG
jgi:two-component system sensor histidine kinase/response regulator